MHLGEMEVPHFLAGASQHENDLAPVLYQKLKRVDRNSADPCFPMKMGTRNCTGLANTADMLTLRDGITNVDQES